MCRITGRPTCSRVGPFSFRRPPCRCESVRPRPSVAARLPPAGGFEWEACNLLDQGCEFSGSPSHDGEALGATTPPAYFRVDLGVRKHWHFHLGGRDAVVALFGTVTNLFDRSNVLTYLRDPSTGDRQPVEMRPLAPLLVGLDWRF